MSTSIITENHTFFLYGKEVNYTLYRTERRTLQIAIHPDSKIIVRAPKTINIEEIEAILNKRNPWIHKTLTKIAQLPPPLPPRQWISGETHRYLGRQYRLKIIKSHTIRVKLKQGFFNITVPNPDDKPTIEKAMNQWYKDHAAPIFLQRLHQCQQESKAFLGLHKTEIPLVIRQMKTRWGSCTSTGRITLNLELIKAPLDCIEYVIMHELCHLKEMNHSSKFWQLLDQCMPDWERRKKRLHQLEF